MDWLLRKSTTPAILLVIALAAMLGVSASGESLSLDDDFSMDVPAADAGSPSHPNKKRACQSCHEPRNLPTVDTNILAHSVHADLSCGDCHSDMTHPRQVECGTCHSKIVRKFRQGSHAIGGHKDGYDVPKCVNCHGTHDITKTDGPTFRNVIPQRCAVCHEERYKGYMDRFHGQAAALGMDNAPRCEDCHNPHAPLPSANPKSQVAPANLLKTCGKCHEDANENFTEFDPHPQPHNKEHSPLVYYLNLFMELLLVGVFGFFGLHTLLWLQRSVVAWLRREYPPLESSGNQYIQRFSPFDSLMHVVVIISFVLLAMTGLPLQHAMGSGAQFISGILGGEPVMRSIHHICGVITFGYFFVHLVAIGLKFIKSRDVSMFYGFDSLVPNLQDGRDMIDNFAWFFYLKPRPKLGRWTYWEKFDYWAVFWGVAMIGVSGLMLWFPTISSRLLPGQLLNVAAVIHGEEALLAVGFIFVFHFFHNHLRPENFPMDVTIFTGRLPLERFKEERSAQYEQLVAEGKLDEYIVGPPSRWLVAISTIFGTVVVIIGLALIADVFLTILSGL